MSNIDKQVLRWKAEKATQGEWWSDSCGNEGTYGSGDDCVEGFTSYAVYGENNQILLDTLNSTAACISEEYDGEGHVAWDEVGQRNAEFVAAANPATVLALLDELEAKDKRIAELEALEVREEGNQFLVVRHPGKAPVIKHSSGDLEGFLRQLLENDPMSTIDIVTHRYYGVGGQWVQDADEYLHMMAAAAGKGE